MGGGGGRDVYIFFLRVFVIVVAYFGYFSDVDDRNVPEVYTIIF